MEKNKILAWGALVTLFIALISYHLFTLYNDPFALSEEDFEYYENQQEEVESSDQAEEITKNTGENPSNQTAKPESNNAGGATDAIPPDQLGQKPNFNNYVSAAGGFTFSYPLGWIVEQVSNAPSDIAGTYVGVRPENRLNGDQSMYFRVLLNATSMPDAQNKVYAYWQSVLNDVPKPFFKGDKEEIDSGQGLKMWRYLANFGREDFYLYIVEIIPGQTYMSFERPDPYNKDKSLSQGYDVIIQSLRPA